MWNVSIFVNSDQPCQIGMGNKHEGRLFAPTSIEWSVDVKRCDQDWIPSDHFRAWKKKQNNQLINSQAYPAYPNRVMGNLPFVADCSIKHGDVPIKKWDFPRSSHQRCWFFTIFPIFSELSAPKKSPRLWLCLPDRIHGADVFEDLLGRIPRMGGPRRSSQISTLW